MMEAGCPPLQGWITCPAAKSRLMKVTCGTCRVGGIRGRGIRGNIPFFRLVKHNGCVYAEIVPDCSKPALQAIISGRVELESRIHSDGWRGYGGLVGLSYQKNRVEHGNNKCTNKHSHIYGIENVWAFAKAREVRFSVPA